MNDTERFIEFFKENGSQLTLGMIMKTTFAAEYRKHMSIIREMPGYEIPSPILDRNTPSNNLYTMYVDRKPEKKLSQEKLDKIKEYEAIRDRYASTSNQIAKINQSIERLKKK